MKQITLTCEIITPLFMSGADKKGLELRPSSFKGMMRFWWRALHPHLKLDELREQEGNIFGSSQENIGKSKFSILIKANQNLQTIKTKPVPTKNFDQLAISPNQTFEIILRFRDKKYSKTVLDIMMITSILGGFGRRSRRGFGSIKVIKINPKPEIEIQEINLENIKKILNLILKKEIFIEENNELVQNNDNQSDTSESKAPNKKLVRQDINQFNANFPFIKEIYLGREHQNYNDLLLKIAQSAHNNDCEQTGFTRKRERFASPIYVSIIKNKDKYHPIITVLNPALNREFNTNDKTEQFIKEILFIGGKK